MTRRSRTMHTPTCPTCGQRIADDKGRREAEYKAAVSLGVDAEVFRRAAQVLWGRRLSEERDARAGDGNHATRGHITRELMNEVARHLDLPRSP